MIGGCAKGPEERLQDALNGITRDQALKLLHAAQASAVQQNASGCVLVRLEDSDKDKRYFERLVSIKDDDLAAHSASTVGPWIYSLEFPTNNPSLNYVVFFELDDDLRCAKFTYGDVIWN